MGGAGLEGEPYPLQVGTSPAPPPCVCPVGRDAVGCSTDGANIVISSHRPANAITPHSRELSCILLLKSLKTDLSDPIFLSSLEFS